MSDPTTLARSAREQLAQGLAALQSPGVPPHLLDVAEPVAQAMSSLHQVEASAGTALPEHAPRALDAVRRALAQLQGQDASNPAVNQAIEAVAGSLNLVHQLSTAGQPGPAQQPAAPAPQRAAGDLAFAGTMVADPSQLGAPAASQAPRTQPSNNPPAQAPPHAPQPQPQPQPQPHGFGHTAPVPQESPFHGNAPQAAAQQPLPASPGGAPSGGGTLRFEAELGAHSATNFYKGLSSNDIMESGGIFIATYQLPKIGQTISIHVSLPGGYEFEATGVVRWTREAPLSSPMGAHSPPGFGAQFTNITQEGRQLVYRYVRNREPLFHDDL